MRQALLLARRGRGRTSPNPMVGAVVVAGGLVAGTGWHRGIGAPHAEVLALEAAGASASGATVYVSLEPCAHHGRTPPCVEALVAAGVERVVAAMRDPDAQVSGRGLRALRAAGVEVEAGLLEDEAARLNRAYVIHRTLGRPFVTYKAASSLDGRIAAADGSSRWITGAEARRDGHRLRAVSDAVCVGVGTVLADDPSLTVREVRANRAPLRVIVDSKARTPPGAAVLSGDAPTLVAVTGAAPVRRVRRLERAGAEVMVAPTEGGRVALPAMLSDLAGRGVVSLLLEGGGRLAGAFAAAGLIDRYLFYLAPKLIGGDGTTGALQGWAAAGIEDAARVRLGSVRRIGEDLRVEAYPASTASPGRASPAGRPEDPSSEASR